QVDSHVATDSSPRAVVRDAICGSASTNAPTEDGMTLRMKRVGPPMNTMSASTTARTTLMFDSHWMPRSIPETAEATNAAVSTAMMITSTGEETEGMMPADWMPPPIWMAPSPREQADPNSVARIARMLMTRPPVPLTTLSPKIG